MLKMLFFVLFFGLEMQATLAQNPDEDILLAENARKSFLTDSAVFYFERAAATYEKTGEIEKLLNAYNQVGIILTRQDRYPQAKKYLEAAKGLHPKIPGPEGLSISTTYISLGVLYAAEKHFDLSIQQHHRALQIRRRLLSESHSDVATSYGNLGNVFFRMKNMDSAIFYHALARDIRERLFGKNSVELVQSFTNLGNAYREKKEYGLALKNYERALENKIIQRGEGHKELRSFYQNLGEVYKLMGRMEEAAALEKTAASLPK